MTRLSETWCHLEVCKLSCRPFREQRPRAVWQPLVKGAQAAVDNSWAVARLQRDAQALCPKSWPRVAVDHS